MDVNIFGSGLGRIKKMAFQKINALYILEWENIWFGEWGRWWSVFYFYL